MTGERNDGRLSLSVKMFQKKIYRAGHKCYLLPSLNMNNRND